MSSPSPAPLERRDRIPALDGLRFLAAFMVLGHHWIGQGSRAWEASTPKLFPTVHPMAAYGWLGVELFFLISGFVICMTAWDRSLGDFFASRIARLYPAYWAGVLITALVCALIPTGMYKALAPRELLLDFTMIQELLKAPSVEGVYWSLMVELKFYLLFALCVVWRGVTYRRAVLFCVLWSAASAFDTGISGLNSLLIGEFSMYFVAGIAMYLMWRHGPNLLLWGIIGFSWLRAQHIIQLKVKDQSGWDARPLEWSTSTLILTAFFLLMIAVSLRWDGRLKGRWLTELGKLTYPLYLIHSHVGATLIHVLHDKVAPWLLLALLFVGVLAVSWLVERFIERPWGRVIRQRLSDAIAQARRGGRPVEAPTLAVAAVAELPTEPVRAESR